MRFPQSQVIALCHGVHATARSATACSRPLQRSLHQTSVAFRPRQRSFFTSNLRLSKDGSSDDHTHESSLVTASNLEQSQQLKEKDKEQKDLGASGGSNNKKKPKSSAATKKKLRDPLRRVASIAQRSSRKPPKATRDGESEPGKDYSMTICAFCVAESFNMKAVVKALQDHNYLIDPDGLDFDEDEVIHVRPRGGQGDFFIFETGTVVTWSLPPELGIDMATGTLLKSAENPHTNRMDRDEMTEKLEYEVDASTSHNSMRGDTVVLGIPRDDSVESDPTDGGRAKIAFSSGLARSTKVAVLEALLNSFLERTEELPAQLRSGQLSVSKREILQLTGELLHLRSQLNFFSELTDSLPDKFWDQRAELKLDSIYDQVGKALDVASRIKVLNQRMDYADSMLGTFRDMLDQKLAHRLEWIIIWLIAVEVGFHLIDWSREYRRDVKTDERTTSAGDFGEWLVGIS